MFFTCSRVADVHFVQKLGDGRARKADFDGLRLSVFGNRTAPMPVRLLQLSEYSDHVCCFVLCFSVCLFEFVHKIVCVFCFDLCLLRSVFCSMAMISAVLGFV